MRKYIIFILLFISIVSQAQNVKARRILMNGNWLVDAKTGDTISTAEWVRLQAYLDTEVDPIYANDSINIIWFKDTILLIATKADISQLSGVVDTTGLPVAGNIAKFTAPNKIGNSNISDDGTDIIVNNDLYIDDSLRVSGKTDLNGILFTGNEKTESAWYLGTSIPSSVATRISFDGDIFATRNWSTKYNIIGSASFLSSAQLSIESTSINYINSVIQNTIEVDDGNGIEFIDIVSDSIKIGTNSTINIIIDSLAGTKILNELILPNIATDTSNITLSINTNNEVISKINVYAGMYLDSNTSITTINTQYIWEKVSNMTQSEVFENASYTTDTTWIDNDGIYEIKGSGSGFSVIASQDYELGISINGNEPTNECRTLNNMSPGDAHSFTVTCLKRLYEGDYIVLKVRDVTDTRSIRLRYGNVIIKKLN